MSSKSDRRVKCPRCCGDGWIRKIDNLGDTEDVDCPKCGGNGRVKESSISAWDRFWSQCY